MYEAFYGLREKPFSILPDPDLVYWGTAHRLAFTMLEFGVINNTGFTVITGEIGSGKTTLVRCLLRRLDPGMTVGLISNTPHGGDELLRWISISLNLPFEGSIPALTRRFQEFVHAQYAKGQRTIIIIDEAQNLGLDALEALRMWSNVNADKYQFLQLILVGQPQLKELLRAPQLLQFAQRVSSDFHLGPLAHEEVASYIDYRLDAVGSREQLFAAEACTAIAKASSGIPRVINMLCDTSLVYGFATGAGRITVDLVREVIKDKNNFGIFPMNGQLGEVLSG
jgi:type II secretory pathway predicted ATPase ExeA